MSVADRTKLMMAGVSVVGTTAVVRVGRDLRSLYVVGLSVQQIVDMATRMQSA